ncbi:UNVERIFIED_CONTAM: hypothetical protein FKN15_028804 [Acipenser sinensis]
MASRGGATRPNGQNAGNKICQFKLVLLGESAVGKSSLVLRFVKGQFHEFQESTIGAAFLTQTVCLDDTTVKFEIWDTAGQERYHSLAPMYYRGGQAAIVVYDITNEAEESSDHVSHLENVSEEEMNRLLGIALDVEYLFTCVHKEEDADTKQVYFYLFKLLRKCILQMGKPVVEGALENPPFEKPSIEQGVNNFVQYKFSHLPSKERQTIVELAKMFLNQINYWHLETPSQRRLRSPNDDPAGYKVNYTRWLCYCNVPQFCDSLPWHETTQVFGRTLLRSVFTVLRRQLLEQARQEKDKLSPEKRTLILTHSPKFLSMLEEEVYSHNSPIWDEEFMASSSRGGQLGIQAVISPPPVARPFSYSASQATLDPANGGSLSPICKASSVFEPSLGEKRKSAEPFINDETKRPCVVGDIPMELITEVMSTITDPAAMLGPEIIKKLIERKQAQIRKVYPGLSCFKEGVRQIPIESIPGINLKTMSERLKNRYYSSKKLFVADMQRIFTNCREYNPPESEYYKCANILEKFFYTKIKEAGLTDK